MGLLLVPLLTGGIAWFFEAPEGAGVRHLGWAELAYAIAFGIFFTAGFHFGG